MFWVAKQRWRVERRWKKKKIGQAAAWCSFFFSLLLSPLFLPREERVWKTCVEFRSDSLGPRRATVGRTVALQKSGRVCVRGSVCLDRQCVFACVCGGRDRERAEQKERERDSRYVGFFARRHLASVARNQESKIKPQTRKLLEVKPNPAWSFEIIHLLIFCRYLVWYYYY